MRTYGRVPIAPGGKPVQWVEVTTDANGLNDNVWLTTLIQVLKLNLNESPFYANYGIPAKQAVIQQVFPDWYIWETQRQFAPHFASLIVAKEPGPIPTYTVNVTTNQGVKAQLQIAT
jgi:hypothetical protein